MVRTGMDQGTLPVAEEGLFLATLRGRGKIWLQSLPFSRLADRVLAHALQGGGRDQGGGIDARGAGAAVRRAVIGGRFGPAFAPGGLRGGIDGTATCYYESMKRFRKKVHRLQREPAGHRFQRMNDEPGESGRDGPWERLVKLLLGPLLILAGLFMLAAPGPGLLAILLGLAVLASSFRPVARLLDRGEVLGREGLRSAALWWTEASTAWKIGAAVFLFVLLGAAGWGGWVAFFGGQ